jgi:hypothetical protein
MLARNDAAEKIDQQGMTVLHYACAFGAPVDVIQVLLER